MYRYFSQGREHPVLCTSNPLGSSTRQHNFLIPLFMKLALLLEPYHPSWKWTMICSLSTIVLADQNNNVRNDWLITNYVLCLANWRHERHWQKESTYTSSEQNSVWVERLSVWFHDTFKKDFSQESVITCKGRSATVVSCRLLGLACQFLEAEPGCKKKNFQTWPRPLLTSTVQSALQYMPPHMGVLYSWPDDTDCD